jgi:hypothetical protein
MIISRLFKRIKRFTLVENGKTKDLFKIWFLDNTTDAQKYSKIMEKK